MKSLDKSSCNCEICQRGREFKKHLERIPEEERNYFEDIYVLLMNVESDRDWAELKLAKIGKLSDEVAKRALEKIKKKVPGGIDKHIKI